MSIATVENIVAPTYIEGIKQSAAQSRIAVENAMKSDRARELGETALKGAAAGLGAGLVLLCIHKVFGT